MTLITLKEKLQFLQKVDDHSTILSQQPPPPQIRPPFDPQGPHPFAVLCANELLLDQELSMLEEQLNSRGEKKIGLILASADSCHGRIGKNGAILSAAFKKVGVNHHTESLAAVPEPMDTTDLLTTTPILWKRDNEGLQQFEERADILKKFVRMQQLRVKVGKILSVEKMLESLEKRDRRLERDINEAAQLLEYIGQVQQLLGVSKSEALRCKEEEDSLMRLIRRTYTDEERARSKILLSDVRGQREIGRMVEARMEKLADTTSATQFRRILEEECKVLSTVFGDLGEARDSWVLLESQAHKLRSFTRETNFQREGRRIAATAEFEKVQRFPCV